ncbi:MAG: hypothetical protein Q7R48_02860 [bacterium]|nr:hypothetical protein [bacterium]
MTTKEDPEKKANKAIFELNKRLEVVISLLLRMIPKDGLSTSLKERVRILDDLGMRPRDIANTLGRTQPHINKELVGLRKGKNKKNEKEKK